MVSIYLQSCCCLIVKQTNTELIDSEECGRFTTPQGLGSGFLCLWTTPIHYFKRLNNDFNEHTKSCFRAL